MLKLTVIGEETYNEETEEFGSVGDFVLELEHSLLSLSKWESEFRRPFLTPDDKTSEEIYFYIECMILTPNYPSNILHQLSKTNLDEINGYIESPQSATTFGEMPQHKTRGRAEIVTSELIYFWMVTFNIPFECETWHLNRLFALIRICNIKNSKQKKMSRSEVAQRNRELNAQRRAKHNTSG
jgi:hypothetical protein